MLLERWIMTHYQEEESKVKDAVRQSYAREVAKVEHIWNSFLWGHYAQNGKVCGGGGGGLCCKKSTNNGVGKKIIIEYGNN